MTVVAITMARDEADIIGSTVAHLVGQVDRVLVADNLSTDGTGEIARAAGADVVDDPDPAYRQAEKMTALAHEARARYGATWIVPFDADEVWYARGARLGDHLAAVEPMHHLVAADLFDHVATAEDVDDVDPVRSIVWRRRDPAPLPKVAVRYRPDVVIHQGNHGAHFTAFVPAAHPARLVVRHFPYRSPAQLVRKVRNGAAAYLAAGDTVAADAGAHWRQWGRMLDEHGEGAIADLFRKWYWRASPSTPARIDGELQPPLVFDPAYDSVHAPG